MRCSDHIYAATVGKDSSYILAVAVAAACARFVQRMALKLLVAALILNMMRTTHCTGTYCSTLPTVTNADITYTTQPDGLNQVPVDTLAVYTCTNGELFEGDAIRVCSGDGSFDGIEPICAGEQVSNMLHNNANIYLWL